MRFLVFACLAVSLLSEPSFAARRYVRQARGRSCSRPVSCYNQTNELYCMACAISGEARGETPEGQVAVGRVILARVVRSGYPKSTCGVTHQATRTRYGIIRQFDGWAGDHGRVCETQVHYARVALNMGPGRATNFHATYVNPHWRLARLGRVGGHIFYADRSSVTRSGWQKYADLQRTIFGGQRTEYASLANAVE